MSNELKDQNNSGYSGHAGGGYGYGGGGGGSGGSGQYNNSGGYTGYSRPGQPGGYGSPPPQAHYQQTGAPRFYGPIAGQPVARPPQPVSYPPERTISVDPYYSPYGIHGWGARAPSGTYTEPYDTTGGSLTPGNDGSYYPGGPPGYKSDARGGDSIGHTTISKNNLGGGSGSTPDPGQNQNQMAPMSQVNSPSGSAPNIRMLLARSLMAHRGTFGGFGK